MGHLDWNILEDIRSSTRQVTEPIRSSYPIRNLQSFSNSLFCNEITYLNPRRSIKRIIEGNGIGGLKNGPIIDLLHFNEFRLIVLKRNRESNGISSATFPEVWVHIWSLLTSGLTDISHGFLNPSIKWRVSSVKYVVGYNRFFAYYFQFTIYKLS
jgi:hypothetical protein